MKNPSQPVLCLVTDRRRLAAALGISAEHAISAVVAQVHGAILGGVDLVQVREPDLEAGALFDLTQRLVTLRGAEAVRIVVNDRLDVARATGADGLHLKESGVPLGRVRSGTPPGFLLGRSVHSAESAQDSGGADYLIAGPVFDTESKPGCAALLGLDGLRRIVSAAVPMPVLGIGGISAGSARQVRAAGAAGIAAIGAFIPSGPVPDLADAVQRLTQALRIAFDSPEYVP